MCFLLLVVTGWMNTEVFAQSRAMPAAADGVYDRGVTLRLYEIGRPMVRLAPLAPDQTPNVDRRIERIDLSSAEDFGGLDDFFVVRIAGELWVEHAGEYWFRLESDDGSVLEIGGVRVVDHDGIHPATGVEGGLALESGWVPLSIEMFENTGGQALRLAWRPPGAEGFSTIPAESLRTRAGVTRVVSPGPKVLLDGRADTRPGLGQALDGVHPGWSVETVRPEGWEPSVGAMGFLADGSLVYTDFTPLNSGVLRTEPNGTLWMLRGVAGGRGRVETPPIKVADGFHDPTGLAVVDGDVFVAHRTGIERLRDQDGDGVFENPETFAQPWIGDNYHHFSFGLQHHDGWLYGALSTSIFFDRTLEIEEVTEPVLGLNGPNPPHRGALFRTELKSGRTEFLAGGLRTPNGVLVTDNGEVYVSDNQGAWLPANRLNHVQPGRFYGHYNGLQASRSFPDGGHRSLFVDQPPSPPAVWLPPNEVSNSPTTPVSIHDGPFAGQLYLGELTTGGIRRVFLETVEGQRQGAVFRFTQGLESGVNRLIWGPDGCLYVGGTGGAGNWSWRGTTFGLQRLRPTGAAVFEMHSVSATPDGFVVRFTDTVDRSWLSDPTRYHLEQWAYFATPAYGGAKQKHQRLVATEAHAAEDGRSVRLVVPDLQAGAVVYLRCNPRNTRGEPIWSGEAWYTLNRIPATSADDPDGTTISPHVIAIDALDGFREPRHGWVEGGDAGLDGEGLSAAEGAGVWVAPRHASNLLSRFEHGDAEVSVEFMIGEGSNSGVYMQGRYEIQVLDSHGKAEPAFDDAGGVYQRWDPARGVGREGFEGRPPRVNAAEPAGRWQRYEMVFRAPRFDPLGRKVRNARFERVVHNGVTIHEGVELSGPTRAAMAGDEAPFGPVMLQGDHGPVAFRNLRIRPLPRVGGVSDVQERAEGLRVLVFSATRGFRHDSIPDAVACFEELADAHGFVVTATEDPAVFGEEELASFDVVVFANTTGDVLDEAQQSAFQRWYRRGGGFVGVHSAADTEADWGWYAQLVGGLFESHPAIQPARVVVHDCDHPATRHLPDAWNRTDEWYNFDRPPPTDAAVLMSLVPSTYRGGNTAADGHHPIAWCRAFDGGRTIYTAGGHTAESFADPAFRAHLLGAVVWAASSDTSDERDQVGAD